MAQINETITLNDRFSSALDRFCSGLETAEGKLSDLSEKLLGSGKGMLSFLSDLSDSWDNAKQKMEAYKNSIPVKLLEEEARLKALYGDSIGGSITQQYTSQASELGRRVEEYMPQAVQMTRMGMGSNDVKSWMAMADKMATITGKEFADVASSFSGAIQGHSVGALTDTLGGGEGVERMLKRAGVERMLNRGNLDGALKAYEKIAEKLGYSKDALDKMNDTIGNRITKVINRVDNIIIRIKVAFTKSIEPVVKKLLDRVDKFLKSKLIQDTLLFVETAFSMIGALAEKVAGVLDVIFDYVQNALDFFSPFIIGVGAVLGGVIALKVGVGLLVKAALIGLKAIKFGLNAIMRHPVLALVTLVAGAITVATNYYKEWREKETGENISFIQALIETINTGVGVVLGMFGNAVAWIHDRFEDIHVFASDIIGSIIETVVNGWYDLKAKFFEKITDAIDGLLEQIETLLDGLGSVSETAANMANKISMTRYALKVSGGLGGDKESPYTYDRYKAEYSTFDYLKFVDAFRESGTEMGKTVNGFLNKFMPGIMGSTEEAAGNTKMIKGMMQAEQEVAFLKDLSERQYVNKLNVQSPQTVINNVFNNKTASDSDAMMNALTKRLKQESEAGGLTHIQVTSQAG